MDNHLTASVRSRSSQMSSPSYSALASATSSLHKRKLASDDHAPHFPSSFSDTTRDGALTSNDDLESISACGSDSDSNEESEEVVDDDDKEYDDSSMRNFTASRLESSVAPPSARNTKLKTANSVKVKDSDGMKDAANGGTSGNAGTPASGGSKT